MSNYWEKRLMLMQNAVLDPRIGKLDAHLAKLYKYSLEENKKELLALYMKIKEEGANGEPRINDLYKYNRYWQVRSDLNRNLLALGEKEQPIFNKELNDMYYDVQKYFNENPKYWAITNHGVGVEKSMTQIDLNSPVLGTKAKYVVNSIWCGDGKKWSDRI